jgi:hypothetical protein
MLKPSLLDHYRDKLFDLREEVREYYLNNSIPLGDNTYIQLRNLINSHLRFTEEMSLIKCSLFMAQVEKNVDLKKDIHKAIKSQFHTKNKDLDTYIKTIRKRAADILLKYMIFSSPLIIISIILITIVYIPQFIIQIITSKIKIGLSHTKDDIKAYISKMVFKIVPTKDCLEEISYEMNLCDKAKIA